MCDDIEDSIGLLAAGGCGRGLTVEVNDDDFVDTDPSDFWNSVDGQRTGHVTTEVQSAPTFPPSSNA